MFNQKDRETIITMTFARLILIVIALLTTENASAKLVGNVDIQFSEPSGHEELCGSSQEAYQYVAKGTTPASLLITCFANEQEWAGGKGTLLFKVEIMRPFINKTLSDAEFSDEVVGFAKAIGYVNDITKAANGAPTNDEKKATDDLLKDFGAPVQYTAKKGTWQHVQRGTKFEIIQMISSIKMQSDNLLVDRDVAAVMALVNIKGKLLTLKVVNSKNEPNPQQSAVSVMRNWIGHLLKENSQ